METVVTQKGNFEVLVQLIDILIWPITFILLLLIFRRNFSEAIQRLGTLKADRTGIELSFEKKIEATKKLFQQIKPAVQSKASADIQVFPKEDQSAYSRILQIHNNVIKDLKTISEKENLKVEGNPPEIIAEKLKEIGGITIQQSKMIKALLEVTESADTSANKLQANEIENLYKKIEIH